MQKSISGGKKQANPRLSGKKPMLDKPISKNEKAKLTRLLFEELSQVNKGRIEIVKSLIRDGADVNATNPDGTCSIKLARNWFGAVERISAKMMETLYVAAIFGKESDTFELPFNECIGQ